MRMLLLSATSSREVPLQIIAMLRDAAVVVSAAALLFWYTTAPTVYARMKGDSERENVLEVSSRSSSAHKAFSSSREALVHYGVDPVHAVDLSGYTVCDYWLNRDFQIQRQCR